MKKFVMLFAFGLAACLTACGDDDSDGGNYASCTYAMKDFKICAEGIDEPGAKSGCEEAGGIYRASSCPSGEKKSCTMEDGVINFYGDVPSYASDCSMFMDYDDDDDD